MKRTKGWRPLLGGLLIGAGLAGTAGCLGFVHPVGPPQPDEMEACKCIPAAARCHVYIFFVNGLDPANLGNLTGLRDYVQALGFHKTYYGQFYHTPWSAKELQRIRAEDPEARFALVGFSLGSQKVRCLAESARNASATIDLMVCLSGNGPGSTPLGRPSNVDRLIVMTAGSGKRERDTSDGTEEYHLADASYFGTPAHCHTRRTLATELLAISCRVHLADPGPPPLPVDAEMAPPPRRLPPPTESGPPDEWDFLKPNVELSPMPELK
jgi:hypothetical protein